MAYFDKTEYAKYVSLQNVSASGDPADAPEGGVYLYASGTAADPNEAHLWLRNAGGAPIDLAEGGTLQMAGDSGIDSVDMANDTLTFAGGDGLTSAVSDNQVSFSLNANSTSFQIASDEIQLASAVAGDGLSLSSHALAVNVAGGLEIATDNVQIADSGVSTAKIADDAVTSDKIAAAVAGDGLQGGGGSALAVDVSDFAGAGLEDDGSENLRIAAAAAGDGLQGGGGSALAVDVSDFAGDGLADDGSENLELSFGTMASEMTGDVADTDEFAISDDGIMKKVDFSVVRDAVFADISGDATVAAGGALTIANDAVLTVNIFDGNVTTGKLADGSVTTAKIADDAVTGAKIAADAVDSEHYAAGSIDNEHIADATIANAKLVNDSVTLTAGAGMAALGEVDLGASITVAVDGVLEDLDSLGAPSADGEFIVATGAGAFAYESGDTARTSLGLGTGDSPAFASLQVSDLTQYRVVIAGASGELEDDAGLMYMAGSGLSGSAYGYFAAGVQSSANIAASGSLVSKVLTNDRVPVVGSNNQLEDSADFTFDGSDLKVGGGYGSTGLTISTAGRLQMNENLTVDGTADIAGGYGSTGVSILADGGINMNGNLQVDGNVTVGADAAGGAVKFFGDSASAFLLWDADKLAYTTDAGSTNDIEIGLSQGGYAIEVAQLAGDAGKIKATAFVTYSDESLKSDIVAMDTALDTVMSLKGVEFTWKNSGERDFGFIAQEVAQVVPQAVSTGNDGISGVDYSRLTSILVEAVKSQQVQIEELKAILKK